MEKITDPDRQTNLRETLLSLLAGAETPKLAGSA